VRGGQFQRSEGGAIVCAKPSCDAHDDEEGGECRDSGQAFGIRRAEDPRLVIASLIELISEASTEKHETSAGSRDSVSQEKVAGHKPLHGSLHQKNEANGFRTTIDLFPSTLIQLHTHTRGRPQPLKTRRTPFT
jgi:hypothetical protein